MFPYLDFAVVSFVLFAGFGLGALFGYFLRELRARTFFDGDGGELIALQDVTDARSPRRSDRAEVVAFPSIGRGRKAV
jgi:hypothetical protein